jgi:hypothetical protein
MDSNGREKFKGFHIFDKWMKVFVSISGFGR